MNTQHVAIAMRSFVAGLVPPAKQTISEWADTQGNRVLSSTESPEPGQWSTDRVPYLREIMDTLSPHDPCQRTVFMKPTQVAGTEAINNWCGAVIERFPAPMLVVQPTIEVGELWSKQRLSNVIANSPAVSKKIRPSRSRDSGNTTMMKEFPGGLLRIAGANSAASLRSMPVQYLALDEVDAYDDDVDGEGDPCGLAEERTNNFPRRKVFYNSTPTIKGASRIEKEYEKSDQRQYFVPCPHCGHYQVLRWEQIKWTAGAQFAHEVEDCWYECEACAEKIEERFKTGMLEQGEWRPRFPERTVRGYHLNSLYSPLGLGRTWRERAQQFLEAKDDPILLKRFVNTALAQTWEDLSSQVKPQALLQRREQYKLRTIPRGCLLLTMGVDTQDDRLEYQIIGWGRNETRWVIDYGVILGDTSDRDSDSSPWRKLDELRSTPIRNQFGVDMRIEKTAVDSGGHRTDEVYHYARTRKFSRVIALRGASQAGKPIIGKPTKVDINHRGVTMRNGAEVFVVGTDTAKHSIFAHLHRDGERPELERRIRFSEELDEPYFDQLTAEVFDPTRNKWVKYQKRRNEALDTFVYATVAAYHPDIAVYKLREHDWARKESLLEPVTGDLFVVAPAVTPAPSEAPRTPAPVISPVPVVRALESSTPPPRRGGLFMSD
ncbi:phage terminase large subunit family protein [Permianibacter sp. IMCC34836]|uniref:phage terminase large subunit family protein n=1 Tax=Permianibacter fluminis TaxID=2738515 RepID=UPI00155427EF|nr:phage terminase large subunit family protein [Permianibacter fluminis]NQD37465.1 phage terminase large subunit family protein [Permianibacter fluminis]